MRRAILGDNAELYQCYIPNFIGICMKKPLPSWQEP
jgi:hypothetical protein